MRSGLRCRAAIQRFTGITQAMVDDAPPAEATLPELAELIDGPGARRAQRELRPPGPRAGVRAAGLEWPDPPVLCTSRSPGGCPAGPPARAAPARRRRSASTSRRPTVRCRCRDVRARVLRAVRPPVRERHDGRRGAGADAACAGRVRPGVPRGGDAGRRVTGRPAPAAPRHVRPARRARRLRLPQREGQTLYVGKSTDVRTRARSHFAPSSPSAPGRAQAESVDCHATESELGALVLEQRLIRRFKPPGNARAQARRPLRLPALPLRHPVPGARGRARAGGRPRGVDRPAARPGRGGRAQGAARLAVRPAPLRPCAAPAPWHPSAYGQMGRCLSPCLHDLDPNLYRARLDAALACSAGRAPAGAADARRGEIAKAAGAQHYERAAWLRAGARGWPSRCCDGSATRCAPPTPAAARGRPAPGEERRCDAFWLVDGRVADWGPLEAGDPWGRPTAHALAGGTDDLRAARGGRRGAAGETRIDAHRARRLD